MLMRKPRSHAEIYNDLDGEVVNVFRVIQHPKKSARLAWLLRTTPFSREEFELAYKPTRSEVERARRTVIRSFMGFGSDSITRVKASSAGFNTRISSTMKTGFRGNSIRSNVTAAVDWSRYPEAIASFCERLKGVIIENRGAVALLKKLDRADALHYIDPPYPASVRNGNASQHRCEHNYRHEMTDKQHEELAEVLHGLKGMVIISSYPGPLYERLYADWKIIDWTSTQFCHAGSKRTEAVWLNAAAWENMPQKRLALTAEVQK